VKAFRLAHGTPAWQQRAASDESLWGELHEKMLEMVNASCRMKWTLMDILTDKV